MRDKDNSRLCDAAENFRRIYADREVISGMTIDQLQEVECSLYFANDYLARNEYRDEILHKLFFDGLADPIIVGEEAESAYYAVLHIVWDAVFHARAKSIAELAHKARVWRRHMTEGFSKSPGGFLEEYLGWSIYKDILRLEKQIVQERPREFGYGN